MQLLLAALMLLLALALILSPLYLVWRGLTGTGSFWIRVLLVVTGLVLCRMANPISVITGKDWKIF